jgi:nucleoside-diphosphate-sugar epimerase
MKSVFITGGSGFIGVPLIRRLAAQNIRVVALARSDASAQVVKNVGAEVCRGDLHDDTAITQGMRGCDTVFHIAGHLTEWDSYDAFYKTNVVGTKTMLAAAKAVGASTFVAVGASAVVMGTPVPMKNVSEDLPLQAPSWGPYIATKAEADQLVREANSPELRTAVIRPSLIWGEGMPTLKDMVAAAQSGNFALPDGGTNLASPSHVDNVVECLLLAEQKARGGEAYHVTDGEEITLKQVLNDLLRTQGVLPIKRSAPFALAWWIATIMESIWHLFGVRSKPPVTRQTLRMIGKDFTLDLSKARRELGYRPIVTWDEGIARLAKGTTRSEL